MPNYAKKLSNITLFAGQKLSIQTSLSVLSDEEIKMIKVISNVEQVMPFAKFSNNSRLINFSPQIKDIG